MPTESSLINCHLVLIPLPCAKCGETTYYELMQLEKGSYQCTTCRATTALNKAIATEIRDSLETSASSIFILQPPLKFSASRHAR